MSLSHFILEVGTRITILTNGRVGRENFSTASYIDLYDARYTIDQAARTLLARIGVNV